MSQTDDTLYMGEIFIKTETAYSESHSVSQHIVESQFTHPLYHSPQHTVYPHSKSNDLKSEHKSYPLLHDSVTLLSSKVEITDEIDYITSPTKSIIETSSEDKIGASVDPIEDTGALTPLPAPAPLLETDAYTATSRCRSEDITCPLQLPLVNSLSRNTPAAEKCALQLTIPHITVAPAAKHTHCCPICNKVLSKNSNLKRHISNHQREVLKCLDCGYSTQSINRFTLHRQVHEVPEVMRTCHICSRVFKSKYSLKAHCSRFHELDGAKPKYQCTECLFTTSSLFRMETHKSYHMSRSRSPGSVTSNTVHCPHCTFTTARANPSALRRHMIQGHTDMYKCTDCYYLSTSATDLHSHKMTCSLMKDIISQSSQAVDSTTQMSNQVDENATPNPAQVSGVYTSHCDGDGSARNVMNFLETRAVMSGRECNKSDTTVIHICDYCDHRAITFARKIRHIRQIHPDKPCVKFSPLLGVYDKDEFVPRE